MKHFARLSAAFLFCASFAHPGRGQDSAPVSAQVSPLRQHDTEQLALTLYNTHLEDGSWTRRDAEPCPRLAHHRFSLFTQVPTDGAVARFFVVYDLETSPDRSSKPWQRGIQIIRLSPLPAKNFGADPSDQHLLAVFNRVLHDEHAAGPAVPLPARINIDDLADCFLAAIGQQRIPVTPPNTPPAAYANPTPIVGGPVTGIMIPLVSPENFTRTANIRVDTQGLLTKADILVQYTAR